MLQPQTSMFYYEFIQYNVVEGKCVIFKGFVSSTSKQLYTDTFVSFSLQMNSGQIGLKGYVDIKLQATNSNLDSHTL